MAHEAEDDVKRELLDHVQTVNVKNSRNGGTLRSCGACLGNVKLKAALGHCGLLVSLVLYCAAGGWVSKRQNYNGIESNVNLKFIKSHYC